MIKELRYVPSTPVASLSSCIKNEAVGWEEVAHGNFCTTGTSVIEVLAFVWDSGKLRSLVNHINWHYTIWRLTEFSKCHNNSSSLVPVHYQPPRFVLETKGSTATPAQLGGRLETSRGMSSMCCWYYTLFGLWKRENPLGLSSLVECTIEVPH